MRDFISIHNVPVSLEQRIWGDHAQCIVYINSYSWIVEIGDYYEFYYTPNHFIGKILKSQMPDIVIDRIRRSYKVFKGEEIGYGQTKAQLRPSSVRLRNLEENLRVGTWYHAQGQNYVTYNDTFICDDMYVENCERECPLTEIDGAIVFDMMRMGCRTRTPHYYNGLFEFPCFHNINTSLIDVYLFDGMNWDAKLWASEFKSLSDWTRVHSSKNTADEIREMRAEVFRHTVSIVKQGYYVTKSGTKVNMPDDYHMIHNTVFYSKEIQSLTPSPKYTTEISVENMDCLIAARKLQEDGYNVAVLNLASRQNPGGGVYSGAGAQEENLFRRTTLYRSMFQYAAYAQQYGLMRSSSQYPLDRNFGGIYTPEAVVFRDIEVNGYELLDSLYRMTFISVPAMNHPDVLSNNTIADHHIEPIKNKMRTIFRIGLIHGHDSLVLGAFGCGAYGNPPRHIARLFREVLEEPEFRNSYRKIIFAILDDHNSYREHNPEGNFKPFLEEFGA